MPVAPFSPTATITTEASISVISVIPDTGLVPTMAIALAATVVNRNAMPATSRMATMLCNTFPCITSKKKNSKISRMVKMDPKAIIFMERSFCVRMTFASTFLPPISLAASPTALFIMPHERTIPITPAMAIPPIPILLAYSLNITSGDISLMVCVKAGFHAFSTWSPNNRAIPGTITSHTTNEPAQMIAAYFKPTI